MIARADHSISRSVISESALKVLYRLKDAEFDAYLVGGAVRDLLLGRDPKDFDIATSATPEEVRALFRNSRIIGRRFKIVHVRFGREIIEVATFRAAHDERGDGHTTDDGMIVRDNVYGDLCSDSWRRDFTLNALYYDIRDFSVVDYTGGMEDVNAGLIRMIGDPEQRYREDPVRMIRAVRFAAKLGFRVEEKTEQPLFAMGSLLREVSNARMFDEVLKLFHSGQALSTFEKLRHYGLFAHMFPHTEKMLAQQDNDFPRMFVSNALANTDARINEGKSVTPAFLFAAFLWEGARQRFEEHKERGLPELQAMQEAGYEVWQQQFKFTAIPKRFSLPMREIWELQPRFQYRQGKRPLRLLTHPRFRAAYDFLCLRAKSGEDLQDACKWWTEFQEAHPDVQQEAIKPRPRRRPRRRKPS